MCNFNAILNRVLLVTIDFVISNNSVFICLLTD